jgi:DNA-binding NarL/FixJ family response regulator
MKLSIFLVDDHETVRKSILSTLTLFDDIVVIGEASNGLDAVNWINAAPTKPDVILMDVNMPMMDGVEATRQIKNKHPQIRIIALSLLTESHYVNSILESGAEGYLLKSTGPKELYDVVRANNKRIDQQAPPKLEPPVFNTPATQVNDVLVNKSKYEHSRLLLELNNKQKEILLFLSQDFDHQTIAKKLMLEPDAYNFLMSDILAKFNLQSSDELLDIVKQKDIMEYLNK